MKCDPDKRPTLTKDQNKVYIWKSIKNNPNLYCWIPVSKKNVIPESLDFKDLSVQDIPIPPNFDKDMEDIEKHAEKYKTQIYKKNNDIFVFNSCFSVRRRDNEA